LLWMGVDNLYKQRVRSDLVQYIVDNVLFEKCFKERHC